MLLGLGLATETRADNLSATTAQSDRREGNPEATEQQNAGNMQTDQSQQRTTIKGEVVRVDGDMWFIKDARGKEIGLHVDQSTRQPEQEAVDKNKIKGVVVEAVVDDQHHALSISSLDRRNDHADGTTEENK